jgi:hypothetical protein
MDRFAPTVRRCDAKSHNSPGAKQKKAAAQRIAKQLLIINTCRRRQRRYRGIVH